MYQLLQHQRFFLMCIFLLTSSLCYWCRWEEHDGKGRTEVDGTTGPAKQGESKEPARLRVWQDWQILYMLVTSIKVSFLCAYLLNKLLVPQRTD